MRRPIGCRALSTVARRCLAVGYSPGLASQTTVAGADPVFFFSSRRRHTRFDCDWSSDVCSSDLTLTLTLKVGTYEVYCPVGEDSHKKLGMETHLKVVASGYDASETSESHEQAERLQAIRVTGGGPVIQILPGPFPFPEDRKSTRLNSSHSQISYA